MDAQPDPDFFWYFLSSDQEVSEILAITLVEDIIKRSQDVIFEKHIESQVLPYAVRFSQNVMERVIGWEFFKHDPGIKGDLSRWRPEQEPLPAKCDSWARGSVPRLGSLSGNQNTRKFVGATEERPMSPSRLAQKQRSISTNAKREEHNIANATASITESAGEPVIDTRQSSAAAEARKQEEQSLKSRQQTSVIPSSYADQALERSAKNSANSKAPTSNSSLSGKKTIPAKEATKKQSLLRDPKNNSVKEKDVPIISNIVNDLTGRKAAALAKSKIVPDHTLRRETVEENYRVFQKIKKLEKDATIAPEYTYDQDGKIMFIRKPVKSKFAPQNIKTRIIEHDENGQNYNTPVLMVSGSDEVQASNKSSGTKIGTGAALVPTNRKANLPSVQKAATGKTASHTTGGGASNTVSIGSNTVPVHFFPNQSSSSAGSAENPPPIFVQDTNLEAQNTADSIRLAPGVIFREGETVKKGIYSGRLDVLEYGKSFARGSGTSSLYKNFVHTAKPDDVLECVLDNTDAKVKPVNLTLKPVT